MSSSKRNGQSPNDKILHWLAGRRLEKLNKDEMRTVINMLGPREELYTGIQYLGMVLEEEGTAGVIRITKKGKRLLDREGKFLGYDFDDFGPNHKRYYQKVRPDLLNRREFLNTVGWGAPGIIAVAVGVAKTGEEVTGFMGGEEIEEPPPTRRGLFKQIEDWIDHYLAGPSEMLIGAALINEAVEKYKEFKLEQIANAIAEMADLMERQHHRQHNTPGG